MGYARWGAGCGGHMRGVTRGGSCEVSYVRWVSREVGLMRGGSREVGYARWVT